MFSANLLILNFDTEKAQHQLTISEICFSNRNAVSFKQTSISNIAPTLFQDSCKMTITMVMGLKFYEQSGYIS